MPFIPENGFGFGYSFADNLHRLKIKKRDIGYGVTCNFIDYNLNYEVFEKYIKLNVSIANNSSYDFAADNVFFELAVNSYMENYPQWSDKFFPTLVRLENTHFYGYFMAPNGKVLAIAGEKPIASYNISYAHPSTPHLNNGHRIYNTSLVFYNNAESIDRLPNDLKILKKDDVYTNSIYLIPLDGVCDFEKTVSHIAKIPVISAEKYTLELNEKLNFNVISDSDYNFTVTFPGGKTIKNDLPILTEYGLYKIKVTTTDGKAAESSFFVRKSWDFYLYNAAKEAVNKPQKASTHTESWYGLFSLFLAEKYFDDAELFKTAHDCFNEIMPLMFDFENAVPTISPTRIQNTALFVSLLVDLYETNEKENLKYLKLASRFGDFLVSNQSSDGAYRNRKVHYTCVIYIAKSMMELVNAEKNSNDDYLISRAKTHYLSVKRAIDELAANLDNIDTEGELTFEDGMISCSALQIALFALTLPNNERKKYIDAAEYMIKIHSCLEQQYIPDCRMNGGSLRFWESQFDVMIHTNTFNSPHGWTAWTAYAYYYLYLLTGKKFYLIRLMNTICACAQLLSLDGELRWAFFSQPFVKAKTLVPDTTKPVKDGYKFVKLGNQAYRGKYVQREFKEEYVDMISGWYRIGNQLVNGGYSFCPLILPSGNKIVDNQGGCCDNDVHEIFKCIEETVMRKAFIHQNEDGSFLTYGCTFENNEFKTEDNVSNVVYSVKNNIVALINGKHYNLNSFGTLKL